MNDPAAIQHSLLMCVYDGNIDAVRILIEKGANINHVWGGGGEFDPGDNALLIAIQNYKFGGGLHDSASTNIDMVKLLLDHGANPNSPPPGIPIHEALNFGSVNTGGEIVKALVLAGADVNVKLKRMGTPLHGVYCCGDQKMAVSVAQLLISKGALVDAKNDRGNSPLDDFLSDNWVVTGGLTRPPQHAAKLRALAKVLLRGGASTTGCRFASSEFPAKTFVAQVLKRGGWKKYEVWHKRVLAGLVSKCSKRVDLPDDAAGLVVDFYCPSGGS